MVFRNFIIIILCFLVMSCAHAGIRLNKTRVIFNEKNPSTSITFSNTGKDNYLVEAAVIDPGLNKVSDSFMVIPPIFRSEGGQSSVLKIIRKGGELASDKESDYRRVLNAIPASERNTNERAARVSFSLGFSVKLFYRPESLKHTPDDAYKRLTFHRKDSTTVIARNDSEYNLSLSQLFLGKQQINLNKQPSMIRPFDSVVFKTPEAVSEARWRLINDFGGETEEHLSRIQQGD